MGDGQRVVVGEKNGQEGDTDVADALAGSEAGLGGRTEAGQAGS